MRKVLFFMLTSLDGYFEGPNHEIDWHNVDAEFHDFSVDQVSNSGMLLFGRVTYEMMASYWPSKHVIETDPTVAGWMNSLPKIVFSRTLTQVDWENTQIIKNNFVGEITRLKQLPGKDLCILGSSDLAVSFLKADLIDEVRIMLNPIVLGDGKPLFKGLHARYKLALIKTKVFKSGNVLLYYEPVRLTEPIHLEKM
jgi:dihydrofolate reductase